MNDTLNIEISTLAKEIVFDFFKNVLKKNNNNYNLDNLKKLLDSYKIETIETPKNAHAKCNVQDKKIGLNPNFMDLDYNEKLFTLVHEYMHAASALVTDIPMPTVIEEGMAEAMAEISLNSYSRKTKKDIKISEESSNYKPCSDLIKTLLASLEKNGKDYEFIYSYFFTHKNNFSNFFQNSFGEKSRDFLTLIDYLNPMMENGSEESIRHEIDKTLEATIKPEFDLDQTIDKVSKKGISDYYYHNLLIERYIFRELSKKYMNVIDFNKFLELLKKVKPITRSKHFNSPELDSYLKIFYFSKEKEFDKILEYIRIIPQEIGIDLLEQNIMRSNNKMKSVINYAGITRNFEEKSLNYLKYYDQKNDKKTKSDFLLKVLDNNKKCDSFYYYQLLINTGYDLSEEENEKLICLIINFLENNLLDTDQVETTKVLAVLPKFVGKRWPEYSSKIVRIYNEVKNELIFITTTANIKINMVDTDNLELEVNFDDIKTIDAIKELVHSEKIVYFKKYLSNGLEKMKENNLKM